MDKTGNNVAIIYQGLAISRPRVDDDMCLFESQKVRPLPLSISDKGTKFSKAILVRCGFQSVPDEDFIETLDRLGMLALLLRRRT